MLQIDDHDRVRLLTLDRPDSLNAFSDELYRVTAAALHDAADRHETACVVLTGAGRAFSSGQDLGEMSRIDQGTAGAADHGFPVFMDALTTFPKPLVVAVNGLAVGIGFTLLLHADLVLASRTARFRAPFTSLGVVPEAAASLLMPEVMGRQPANWALYTSRWISADEARSCGLAWQVTEPDALVPTALDAAAEIARMPTVSLRATKQLVLAARADAVAAARAREDAEFQRLLLGPANLEALTAFLEKRDPDFSGLPPDA